MLDIIKYKVIHRLCVCMCVIVLLAPDVQPAKKAIPPTTTEEKHHSESDAEAVGYIKPQRRRLSNYMGRPRGKNWNPPLWLKQLLQDDVHMGHHVGAKMDYLRPTGGVSSSR